MNRSFRSKKISRIVLLVVIVMTGHIIGYSAVFTVTRNDDRNAACNSGIDCSLREAVSAAVSLVGDDTIEFSPNLTSVTLASEIRIVAAGSISINGRGANVFTIDGGPGNNRIFSTLISTLAISGMTLSGGNGIGENRSGFGGAIHADGGSLILDRVLITGNSTGSAGGGVSLENGSHRITNSTFSANTAFNCGGVGHHGGSLIMFNTTVSGNTVSQQGGGLCVNGDITMRNITITGNNASNAAGFVKAATGTLNLGNSIIAGNGANEITFNAGAIISAGSNMVGDTPGDAANTGFMTVVYHPSDILDMPPRLGALQNNGGTLPTHSLLAGSPAIDNGNNALAVDPANNTSLSTDQRGFSRFRDGDGNGSSQVDIGALELRAFFVTNIGDNGAGTLRQAIADAAADGDAVSFSGSLFDSPQSIILTGGELVVPSNANFTLNGKGSNILTISGNNQSRVFAINGGARLSVSNLTITGGNGSGASQSGNGGAIVCGNNVKLSVVNAVIRNNAASGNGGGIATFDSELTLINSFVSNNTAGSDGGGIHTVNNQNGFVSLDNSSISGNSSNGTGGGIYSSRQLNTLNSIINGNLSGGDGAGIYNITAVVTLTRSVISNNATNSNGGGIYNLQNLTLTNTTLSGNSAQLNAGGIYNLGTAVLNSTTISGNTALIHGGGIFNHQLATSTVTSSTIANNNANSIGGGVFNSLNATFNARNTIFADNRATKLSPDFERVLTSQGFNLIENTSGTTIAGVTTGNVLGLDAQLLPLGDYGGSTPTHALRPTSPALDKGNNFGISTDQRGKLRPFNYPLIPNAAGGNGTDIGAFERQNSDAPLNVVMDFDGDSRTDISIYRPEAGEWWINRSSNGTNYAFRFGTSSDKLVPGDYTGDGRTDAAFFRPSTGEWFILRSETGSFYSFPFGTSGDVPVVGDFDADGKADSGVFRPSTATWYIRRSSDGTALIQQFGQVGDVPVVADYDGDAKADIAVFRVSAGEWWIQRSRDGLIAFQFGNSTDKPVQGDYTGDGKTDVALFRPASGEWFVLRSENQSFYSFPFGTNGDIPSPGDYDGDGKIDATVFRPSTNTWYAQRTTAGTLIQSFGQSGDVPIPSAFVP